MLYAPSGHHTGQNACIKGATVVLEKLHTSSPLGPPSFERKTREISMCAHRIEIEIAAIFEAFFADTTRELLQKCINQDMRF